MSGSPMPPLSLFAGTLILQGQEAYIKMDGYPVPILMMSKAPGSNDYDAQTAFDRFKNVPNAYDGPTITVVGYYVDQTGTGVRVLYV